MGGVAIGRAKEEGREDVAVVPIVTKDAGMVAVRRAECGRRVRAFSRFGCSRVEAAERLALADLYRRLRPRVAEPSKTAVVPAGDARHEEFLVVASRLCLAGAGREFGGGHRDPLNARPSARAVHGTFSMSNGTVMDDTCLCDEVCSVLTVVGGF